jgi:hypothetical protein
MDHTKKDTFAAFVNVHKGDKFWVDGHHEYSQDSPTLFRFNTSEEKKRVQEVAQNYLDYWGFEAVELVIFEAKSRHSINLKKRTSAEIESARQKQLAEAAKLRDEYQAAENEKAESIEEAPLKKKRGRKPKAAATIST